MSATRSESEHTGTLKHTEHRCGEFLRRVRLDESLDPKSVEADLQNGILTLTIKRRSEAQPVKVAVRVRDEAIANAPQEVAPAGSNDSNQ